jgi:hypothetical protein
MLFLTEAWNFCLDADLVTGGFSSLLDDMVVLRGSVSSESIEPRADPVTEEGLKTAVDKLARLGLIFELQLSIPRADAEMDLLSSAFFSFEILCLLGIAVTDRDSIS